MISKDKRISQELFKAFIKKNRSIEGDFLRLQYAPSKDVTRCAFVVPKSVAKTAVIRNSVRRHGYEAFRTINPQPKQPTLFVFFFKKSKKIPTYKEIYEQTSFLLKKTEQTQ